MPVPNHPPNDPSGDRQHLKFNRDVLPEFKRRPDNWEPTRASERAEKLSEAETDSIIKWVGLGIMVLVAAGVIGVTLHNRNAAQEEQADTPPSALQVANRGRERAKEAVIGYMGAGDIESRLGYVRRSEAVAPLMEKYYRDNELYPLKVWNFEQVEPRSIAGLQFWYAVVNTPEGREFLLLEMIGEDFKVDWETHVGLNPMRPDDYLRDRPSGEYDFRVYVSPVDYYNGPFSDPEKVLSVKLEFANSAVVLYGYIDPKSPDFSPFMKLVDGGEQVALILALEWPESSAAEQSRLPQVKIKQLVSERWLVID